MYTLGINAAYHDSSASLVRDGVVVAAAEEERFTQIKHGKRPIPFAAYELPHAAIDYCLAAAGLELADVDHVAYSYDPSLLPDADRNQIVLPLEPSAATRGAGGGNPWEGLFLSYVVNAPRQLVGGAPHHLDARFRRARAGERHYRWHFVPHHLCHQASAFLAGPPGDAAVLTLDGRGECASTQYGLVRDNRYQWLGEVRLPASLGLLYEQVTRHLGFQHSSDEYKVMALASLGSDALVERLRAQVHWLGEGQYRIDAIDFGALCPQRMRGGEMLPAHLDLAFAAQRVLEDIALEIGRWLAQRSGAKRLLMAGGVALNCVMNAKLRDAGLFDDVWVQPAAGDAGTSLGAALWIDHRLRAGHPPGRVNGSALALAERSYEMSDVYLGPGFDEAAIERVLREARASYHRPDALVEEVAEHLAADRIVGWFQGRMEFGPRALGARSILASPISPAMQQRLNELKDREDFRPVAPVVTEEAAGEWFQRCARSPFMLFVYPVRGEKRERIPSACHADGSARVQTVNASQNGAYHALLQAFERRTGVPVLVNTSFNTRGKPIVCTPRDALECFYTTPLDVLAIGPFVLNKARSGAR